MSETTNELGQVTPATSEYIGDSVRIDNYPDCLMSADTIERFLHAPIERTQDLVFFNGYGKFTLDPLLARRTRDDSDGSLIIQGRTESGHSVDLKPHSAGLVKALANIAVGRPKQMLADISIYEETAPIQL